VESLEEELALIVRDRDARDPGGLPDHLVRDLRRIGRHRAKSASEDGRADASGGEELEDVTPIGRNRAHGPPFATWPKGEDTQVPYGARSPTGDASRTSPEAACGSAPIVSHSNHTCSPFCTLCPTRYLTRSSFFHRSRNNRAILR